MSAQPEALRLADQCDMEDHFERQVRAELLRLYWDELRVREHRDEMCAEVTRLHAQLAAANKACNEMALALERTGKERDYWHARLLAEAGSVDRMRHAAKTMLADIEALPTRSTGYPPYQHSPDWMRQQAADVVRKHLAEKA